MRIGAYRLGKKPTAFSKLSKMAWLLGVTSFLVGTLKFFMGYNFSFVLDWWDKGCLEMEGWIRIEFPKNGTEFPNVFQSLFLALEYD